MAIIEVLKCISSSEGLENLIDGETWRELLEELSTGPDADTELNKLRQAVAEAKNRLSPEHTCPELQTLKEKVYANAADPNALPPLLTRIAELRAELPIRQHERLFARIENAIGQKHLSAPGSTGYSNRARRAQDLFTEFAGRTRIEGATTDRYGNAAGTEYDLGVDGAFEGHTIHVLHLYTNEGFNFSLPTAAFTRKGFRVDRRTKPGSAKDLAEWLADARQLWLISTSSIMLNTDHVDVIRQFWQRGGALYLWGDNEPYYADANLLLTGLFGEDLNMKGNLPGGKVVREIDPSRRGFEPHLITTGLEHLFEGITVASLTEKATAHHGFTPLLYGSAGNLITVVRNPAAEAGAIMVDTAFTRLYCQWDEAGSARYVCNAACFLAAMTLPSDEHVEEEDSKQEPSELDLLTYDPTGAFQSVCDLTGQKSSTWLVMSVEELGDGLRNTSDFVLNDPLSAGGSNCIFSNNLYEELMGHWILDQGLDPFTHKPVVECLPLVDLSINRNLRAFTALLCKCLLGGKYLPGAARLVFFAVIDEMLNSSRNTTHRDAWEYLYKQCLVNFKSTPEFSEMGRPMPLIDAMTAYFSAATNDMVQLRRCFTTVALIGRTLLREGRMTPPQVRTIARRALMKVLVGGAVASEKEAPDTVQIALLDLLYDNFHGIPKLNGGRLVTQWPSFSADVSAARRRIEDSLGETLLTPRDITIVLHAMLSINLRQYSAESALSHMLTMSPELLAVWDSEDPGDVIALLNERFAAYQMIDHSDKHMQVPPFATTYGPSVYRCHCGENFGDPTTALTPEVLLALSTARRDHFHTVYRTSKEKWYPAEGTLHYNLHRAVQRVVKEQFTEAKELEDGMMQAVAAYLLRDGKGFTCDPTLEQCINDSLQSYLSLRRAGQPHPEGVLTIALKAEQERSLCVVVH